MFDKNFIEPRQIVTTDAKVSKFERMERLIHRLDSACNTLERRLAHMKPGSSAFMRMWKRYCTLRNREIRLRNLYAHEEEEQNKKENAIMTQL